MSKKIVSCAMAFLMAFTLMPCSAFAEEASAEGQAESLEAERPAEDDAFGEGGLDEAFFAEDADSLIGTLEADEESAAFAVSAVTGIYLDQTHGNDANDGLTKDTAVRTLEKANELANAKGTRDIFLASVYQVTGTENWDLGGKTIHRYTGGYMIELKDATASLTLQDVVIDGARYSVAAENAAETDSIIKAASGGTIELKSGAILENNKAAQFGSGILAINGVEITMEDGAVIRNNTNRNYELGGGILLGNGSIFTMNGGEISGNTANGGGGGSHGTKYYILHYESNGGTKYEDEKYKKNTVVILDKIPKRVGYTFTGWYADKELTDKITSVKMTSDKTVYAGWQATDVPNYLNNENHFAYIVGYEDGTVRPNANISRAEVAAIFFRLLKDDVRDDNLTANSVFTDVAFGKWYNKSISTMAKIGIVKGRTANAFAPNAPITRAEFAAICSRFDRSNVEIKSDFNDISGHWAENEIRRAASLGWIKGYADGSFKPDQNITRAEAASMINRMLHRLPETVDDLLDGMIQWPDNQPSDWYYINMQEATNSHDFKQKGEINEHWTKLTANPDWDRYK